MGQVRLVAIGMQYDITAQVLRLVPLPGVGYLARN